jgi:hypothetical protein
MCCLCCDEFPRGVKYSRAPCCRRVVARRLDELPLLRLEKALSVG